MNKPENKIVLDTIQKAKTELMKIHSKLWELESYIKSRELDK